VDTTVLPHYSATPRVISQGRGLEGAASPPRAFRVGATGPSPRHEVADDTQAVDERRATVVDAADEVAVGRGRVGAPHARCLDHAGTREGRHERRIGSGIVPRLQEMTPVVAARRGAPPRGSSGRAAHSGSPPPVPRRPGRTRERAAPRPRWHRSTRSRSDGASARTIRYGMRPTPRSHAGGRTGPATASSPAGCRTGASSRAASRNGTETRPLRWEFSAAPRVRGETTRSVPSDTAPSNLRCDRALKGA
jgi:hypothetical protein